MISPRLTRIGAHRRWTTTPFSTPRSRSGLIVSSGDHNHFVTTPDEFFGEMLNVQGQSRAMRRVVLQQHQHT